MNENKSSGSLSWQWWTLASWIKRERCLGLAKKHFFCGHVVPWGQPWGSAVGWIWRHLPSAALRLFRCCRWNRVPSVMCWSSLLYKWGFVGSVGLLGVDLPPLFGNRQCVFHLWGCSRCSRGSWVEGQAAFSFCKRKDAYFSVVTFCCHEGPFTR